MAKARKLKSGAWQTRATKVINGQKVTKSFTINPKQTLGDSRKAKLQSELLAREWAMSAENAETYGVTVGVALERYTKDRERVLSPSTITNYLRLIPLFNSIRDIYISDLKNAEIQALVNEWSISVTSKTIRNRISFLLSALDYAECDRKFKIRYPVSTSKEIKAPDVEEVKKLLENAPDDFKPVLYLAAFGAMRRGEISALKCGDVSRMANTIHVHADMVLKGKFYVYKPFTKTGASGVITLPKFIIDSLPLTDNPEDFIFNMNPNVIGHKYDKLKKSLGLDCNFHSLRHFAASFRSDLQIPKKYIEEVGRWRGSSVLDKVYDNALESNRRKYSEIVNDYIEENFT